MPTRILIIRWLLSLLIRIPGYRKIFWSLARRFVAGETIDAAIEKSVFLNSLGFQVILDYVGEGAITWTEIRDAEMVNRKVVEEIKSRELVADVSLKTSHFGLVKPRCDQCLNWWEDSFEFMDVVKSADESGVRVWLDAELLASRRDLWNFVDFSSRDFNFVGAALQAYGAGEFDSLKFFWEKVGEIIRKFKRGKKIGIRLCKGAYSEEYTLKDKELIRKRYLELADLCLTFISACLTSSLEPPLYLEFATHDEGLIVELKALADERNVPKKYFRIAMLYGRKQKLASHLVSEGYNVAIYVPFGPMWLPYVLRRIQEKPAYLLLPFLNEGKYHKCDSWPEKCILRK